MSHDFTFDITLHSGQSIVVRSDGPADGRPLLLLHGFPESGATWAPILPYLTEQGFRTIAPDLRGHGLSDAPRRRHNYQIDILLGDVLAVIEDVTDSPTTAIDVVGHDWGGALAWALAQRHPDRVRRVVVVAAPHPRLLRQAVLSDPDQRKRSRYVLAAQLPWLPEWWLARRDFFALRQLFGQSLESDQMAHYQDCWSRPGVLAGMLNWYRALMVARVHDEDYRPIEVPLLLVTGSNDHLFGPAVLDHSLSLASDGRHEVLSGVGHSPHREAPQALAALVTNHLAQQHR